MMDKKKVKCPYCGHEQNILYGPRAMCRGIFIRCKARQCRKEFEITIKPGQVVPMCRCLICKAEAGEWHGCER